MPLGIPSELCTNKTTIMENTKIALITGASRGLGKEIALRIAERGIKVILTYHLNKEKAEELVAQIQKKGTKAIAYQLATSRIDTFDDFFNQVASHLKEKTGHTQFEYVTNTAGLGNNITFDKPT